MNLNSYNRIILKKMIKTRYNKLLCLRFKVKIIQKLDF